MKIVLTTLILAVTNLAFAAKVIGVSDLVEFSPDRHLVAWVTPQERLFVKDLKSQKLLLEMSSLQNIKKLKFGPDTLATISERYSGEGDDQQLISLLSVFDLSNGKKTTELELSNFYFIRENENIGALSRRQNLDFSSNGRFLAIRQSSYSCSYPDPNHFVLVDLSDGSVHAHPTNAMVGDYFFSKDSKQLYIFDLCESSQTLHRWDTEKFSYEDSGNLDWGIYQRSGSGDQKLQVLQSSKGSKWFLSRVGVFNIEIQKFEWQSEELSLTNPLLAAADGSGRFLVRSGEHAILSFTGKELTKLQVPKAKYGYDYYPLELAATPNWKYAASAVFSLRDDEYYKLTIWDLSTGAVVGTYDLSELETSEGGGPIDISFIAADTVRIFSRDNSNLVQYLDLKISQ